MALDGPDVAICHARAPARPSAPPRTTQVEQVIASLELSRVADSRIGDAASGQGGLSGGQKRRVTVGIELLTFPSTRRCRESALFLYPPRARALTSAPRPRGGWAGYARTFAGLLFLDEPTTGLVRRTDQCASSSLALVGLTRMY